MMVRVGHVPLHEPVKYWSYLLTNTWNNLGTGMLVCSGYLVNILSSRIRSSLSYQVSLGLSLNNLMQSESNTKSSIYRLGNQKFIFTNDIRLILDRKCNDL